MPIYLLDDTLKIDIFYDGDDQPHDDNICVSIIETCPPGEKLFRVGETNIFLTPAQARELCKALSSAAQISEADSHSKEE